MAPSGNQNKDIGHVASPKSAGNSTVMMGSVVPRQPVQKPALGGLSQSMEPRAPSKVTSKDQKKTSSNSPATRGTGVMNMPAKKEPISSGKKEEKKVAPKAGAKPSGGMMSFK